MTASPQMTTDKADKNILAKTEPTRKTEPTPKKSEKPVNQNLEQPVVNRQATAPALTDWSKDIGRMMDDMFQSWSTLSTLMPFGEALSQNKNDAISLESWKQQADRYFEEINRRWTGASALNPFDMYRIPNGFLFKLKVDIEEDDDVYAISAELPGLNSDDIHLNIDDNVLTISGKKSVASDAQGCVRERRFGSFLRSFTLPDTVDTDQVQATVKNGVLTVNLAKIPSNGAGGKTIPIRH